MSRQRKPPEDAAGTEPSLLRMLALQEETLGENHPSVILTLRSLALLLLSQHRLADALPLLARSLALSEEQLRQECVASLEARLLHVLPALHEEAELLYSLALAWPNEPRVRHLAIAAALLRKSLSVESLSSLSRTFCQGLSPDDLKRFELLRSLRTGMSMLRLMGPGTRLPGEYRQSLEALSHQSDALEEELATRSAPLRWLRHQPMPAEVPHRVAAVLPSDGALVEFVAFRQRPLVPEHEPSSSLPTSPFRYLALLLLSNGSSHCVDLGPAEPMDVAAILMHRALTSHSASFQPAARALYASAVRPLLSLLGTVRRLFIAPDGWLALVPFTELHDGSRFLADAIDITQITSGRDLLPGPEGLPRKRPALFLTSLGLDSPPEP
ncbi:CHAT domain-containing protein [Hyalangium sp.]|uniref:CHAT domain-containing protein n=1 Tax=Hyalangium sp. TaxID=2028555 RepID=UPI002D3BA1E0|nr:CHAT domain-containing protein [Hyalangium sp.]HYH98675.1 CHAT domain-containing protein [Hyalangium sp.]